MKEKNYVGSETTPLPTPINWTVKLPGWSLQWRSNL